MNEFSGLYRCNMCKHDFKFPAALKNATGTYCKDCREEIFRRMKNAARVGRVARKHANDGKCRWLGCELTDHDIKTYGGTVCGSCVAHRRWLLTCIRYSPHAAKYVASAEERERDDREQRNKQPARVKFDARELIHRMFGDQLDNSSDVECKPQCVCDAPKAETPIADDTKDRLAAMEAAFTKLCSVLGVTDELD